MSTWTMPHVNWIKTPRTKRTARGGYGEDTHTTKPRQDKVHRTALKWLSSGSVSTTLVVVFVGGQLTMGHEARKSRRRSFRRGRTKIQHHWTRSLTCRAPRWHLYLGNHGPWWRMRCRWETGHLNRDSRVSAGTPCCWFVWYVPIRKAYHPSHKDIKSAYSDTHQGLPSHILPHIQPWWKATRGSSVLADQTNTAAAFRPGRRGDVACGGRKQEDWLKNDNRYSTCRSRPYFLLFSHSTLLKSHLNVTIVY